MIVDLEWMKKLTHGAVRVTQDENGFQFFRMTEAQMKVYGSNRDLDGKAHAAAGVRFDFRTDAKKIVLECSRKPGSSRIFSYVEVTVKGKTARGFIRAGSLDIARSDDPLEHVIYK